MYPGFSASQKPMKDEGLNVQAMITYKNFSKGAPKNEAKFLKKIHKYTSRMGIDFINWKASEN